MRELDVIKFKKNEKIFFYFKWLCMFVINDWLIEIVIFWDVYLISYWNILLWSLFNYVSEIL